MTGHQPNPGTGRNYGEVESPGLKIEPLVRACGVEHVATVDPYDIKATTEVMREAVHYNGLSVVVAEHPCPLLRNKEGRLAPLRYEIDQERCIKCYTCVSRFSCPALSKEGGEVRIDLSLCIGCGGCAQVCPKQAIGVVQ
jgi:indolepyruvate ferredoxin oxidoreductase alpha subunit